MNTKKGVKLFRLLFLFLLVTAACQSCFTTQTLAPGNINYVKGKKDFLRIHESDSSWIIGNYQIEGKTISGILLNKNQELPKGEIIDLYLAPDGAASITADTVYFRIENIGKAEYRKIDGWKTTGSIIVLIMFFSWFGPALTY
jgi:hypothetical protein